MVCEKCKVIDEDVLTFSMRGEEPHHEFMSEFIDRNCRLCMSAKIREGYKNKFRRFMGNREEFKDELMIRNIKVALFRSGQFDECPFEFCSDEMEEDSKFEKIPRKDRYLVTISEHYGTSIITDDDRLYDSVNSDKDLISECLRSSEALNRMKEGTFSSSSFPRRSPSLSQQLAGRMDSLALIKRNNMQGNASFRHRIQ